METTFRTGDRVYSTGKGKTKGWRKEYGTVMPGDNGVASLPCGTGRTLMTK